MTNEKPDTAFYAKLSYEDVKALNVFISVAKASGIAMDDNEVEAHKRLKIELRKYLK